jgi:hypothetical protein
LVAGDGSSADQIIPAVQHGKPKVTLAWNPVPPALCQHFDPALIDPVEDTKLVRNAGVVGGVLAAESEVFDEGREAVLTLTSPTYCWSRHCCSTDRFGPIILNSLLRNRK